MGRLGFENEFGLLSIFDKVLLWCEEDMKDELQYSGLNRYVKIVALLLVYGLHDIVNTFVD